MGHLHLFNQRHEFHVSGHADGCGGMADANLDYIMARSPRASTWRFGIVWIGMS
jgi:hypothetical protein